MKRHITLVAAIFTFLSFANADAPELISAPQNPEPKIVAASQNAHANGTGRYVVFETKGTLTADDRDRWLDVYLYDRQNKSLKRIAPKDEALSCASAVINETGQFITFHCYPFPPDQSPPPKTSDIFLFDHFKNHVRVVTRGVGGAPHDGEALHPVINRDARFVAFTSNGRNLLEQPGSPLRGIFLFDYRTNSFELISHSTSGALANRLSGDPRISEDGRFVAYRSAATNLVSSMTAESVIFHLYLYDRWQNELFFIDDEARGFDHRTYVVGAYDMDTKGSVVVFETRRRDVESPMKTVREANLFLFERETGTVTKVTTGMFENNSHSPTLSGDGRFVAFAYRGNSKDKDDGEGGLVVLDRAANAWRKVVTGDCFLPSFSSDGSLIVFESDDKELLPKAFKGTRQIFAVQNPFSE